MFFYMKDIIFPRTNFFLEGTNLPRALTDITRKKLLRSYSEGLIFSIDNLNGKYSPIVSLEKVLYMALVYYAGLQFFKFHFLNSSSHFMKGR